MIKVIKGHKCDTETACPVDVSDSGIIFRTRSGYFFFYDSKFDLIIEIKNQDDYFFLNDPLEAFSVRLPKTLADKLRESGRPSDQIRKCVEEFYKNHSGPQA